ncbi:ABC transporter permease subunit [Streptomyces sp. YIM 98790]|uniref:ABC transporter permease subunit n=1 Tax=Streptomyces sp. YIM 98790 TaxID=2689077 RepID=UPI001FB749D3|nr:ABC transporter permease subunit [Streptomyces sp. YIM 98790]
MDIGYRRYDGERLGRSYARRSLFEHSLRGAYGLGRSARSKVLPFLFFAIVATPALVVVAVAVTVGLDELPVDYARYAVFMQPVIGLFLALAAPQMVSLDLRFHTVPLYFSRPIERVDYVAAKLSALTTALILFTGAPVLIMYIGALLAKMDFADQTRGLAEGLAVTVVFSAMHAAIALLVASFTPRRGFGVAAVIAVLTIPYFAATAVQFVAYDQGNDTLAQVLGLFSPGTLIDGLQGMLFTDATDFPGNLAPEGAVAAAYPLVIVGLTVLCCALMLRRYRKAGI